MTSQAPPSMQAFRHVADALNQQFLNKEALVRLMIISVIAGEHMVLIGPPGTAKSALIRTFARLIDARYFEYLLTRFSEPNEIFGPVDIESFRSGTYRRQVEGMLPEAEIVFCDEIFKANSAILNALLTVLNERKFANGKTVLDVPLLSLFGASNELPNDDALEAIFDRFLLRVYSDNLEGYQFMGLIEKGVAYERARMHGHAAQAPVLDSASLRGLHAVLPNYLEFTPQFLATYKNLVFQIRSEGVSLSDRRVVKLLKLFAASALFDGRAAADDRDFHILEHIWNTLDQRELLRELVEPVLAAQQARHDGVTAHARLPELAALMEEVALVERVLGSSELVSDLQLFSQLRNLNGVRQALLAHTSSAAKEALQRVDALLESIYEGAKFS